MPIFCGPSSAGTGSTGVPVGSVVIWLTTSAPADWLLVDGSTFDPADYPTLNSLWGGSTLPDMRFRFPLGAYMGSPFLTNPKVLGGSASHSHTHAHTHTVDPPATVSGGPSGTVQSGILGVLVTAAAPGHTHQTDIGAFNSGAASATNTNSVNHNPPYITVNFVVRGR